jgi:energy-converting hydrogenase B subunit D
LTQAIVGAAIIPVFIALAVKKTQREDSWWRKYNL